MKFGKFIEIAEEMTWEEIKDGGSSHYKSSKKSVEPIDLYKSKGTLRHFCVDSIIKYADRNSDLSKSIKQSDMDKIIHYACMLKVEDKE